MKMPVKTTYIVAVFICLTLWPAVTAAFLFSAAVVATFWIFISIDDGSDGRDCEINETPVAKIGPGGDYQIHWPAGGNNDAA